MFFIGIDIGTSAVKGIVMNETGEILRTVSRDYPLYLFGDGCSEQSPEDWWEMTACALRELTAEYKDIAAVSFSGQMHGLVALDGNGKVLRRAILWNDQRTVAECAYLNDTVGREVLLENAANIALTGFTLPKILWVKNNEPALFGQIKMVMLPKDYIAYRLTGVAATDYSDASGTLLLDVKKQDWSDKMLEIAGLERSQVPKLFKSYESVGTVTAVAAKETGLPETTKVIIGGGDQAVGAIGTGTVEEGTCSVSLGTSGVLFVAMDEFAVDTSPAAIHAFCHATGRYHMMGVTLAAAGSNKWWMGKVLKTDDYKKEEKEITALGQNKVYYLPYLSGERTPHNDPAARGAFVGMSMTTTRAEMTQAMLEGVAFSLRDVLTRIRALGKTVKTARIIGGGANSPLWCQIVADVLNVQVQKIHSGEGPALGAAILAMVGAGTFPTVEDACAKIIKTTETFTPSPQTAAAYDKHYAVFTGLYEALKDSFQKISAI
ncbi:MAG: xylulokinase [Defluviitaleaceae bacterium]|nr:xylulokinase [Defluviitaleaceae bacterium]MCL2240117.1 xylulokinase [Defluviitaleaceae bacterium]